MSNAVAWALDCQSRLYGLISPDGSWLIKPAYEMLPGDFHDGLAVIKEQQIVHYQNGNSNSIFIQGYNCGFIDINGEVVIPVSYSFCEGRSFFSNGLAIVGSKESGFSGYIDKNGEWAIEPRFHQPLPFLGEYTSAGNKDTVYGIIDKSGNWHVKPRFAWLDNFYDGLACCNEHFSDENWDPKSGYANEDGEIVIEPHYGDWCDMDSFSEGRAKLTDGRTHLSIYIDKYGFPVGYTEIIAGGYFFEGLAQAIDPYTKKSGFLGLDGNWAISPTFYHVHDFHDGLAAAVATASDDSTRLYIGGQAFLGTAMGTDTSLWGFIDRCGDWAIEPSFGGIRYFGNGYAPVRDIKTQMWGVIDKEGRWTCAPRFADIGHFHDPNDD